MMKLIENSVKVIKESELAPPQCLCEFVELIDNDCKEFKKILREDIHSF